MTGSELILIAGMMLVTFSIRYGLLAIGGTFTLPARLVQALNYLPPAVLMAIVIPMIFVHNSGLWISARNPWLVGATAAFLIGLWRNNLLLTIATSMTIFLLCQAFIS